MTYAAIATSWAITLLVILALLWGQPAAARDSADVISSKSTEVAWRAATMAAYPQPTVRPCYRGGSSYTGYPSC